MAFESGVVISSGEARIIVRLADGTEIECQVDTGFNGALMLPRELTEALNLSITGQEPVGWIGETRVMLDISRVRIKWLGSERDAEVIINEGTETLIGTELFIGTRLRIDYVAKTVFIETVEA